MSVKVDPEIYSKSYMEWVGHLNQFCYVWNHPTYEELTEESRTAWNGMVDNILLSMLQGKKKIEKDINKST